MIGAEVEVLVAEETTPALFAHALVAIDARAVHTAGISLALVAELTFPAGLTAAFVGLLTMTMLNITSRQTDWFGTIFTVPAVVADVIAARRAGVVSEAIITRPAEGLAAFPIVVVIAGSAILKTQRCVLGALLVMRPVFADRQRAASSHT